MAACPLLGNSGFTGQAPAGGYDVGTRGRHGMQRVFPDTGELRKILTFLGANPLQWQMRRRGSSDVLTLLRTLLRTCDKSTDIQLETTCSGLVDG